MTRRGFQRCTSTTFKIQTLNFINSILQSTEFTHLCTNLQFTFRISENGKGFVMFMTRVKKQEIQKKHFKSGNREEKKNLTNEIDNSDISCFSSNPAVSSIPELLMLLTGKKKNFFFMLLLVTMILGF